METIVFDWKRTLYDPDSKLLIKGAKTLFSFLKREKIFLVLIGKGDHKMYEEVKRLGFDKFFSKIIFKETKKNINLFKPYVSKVSPELTVVVGDRARSEIEIGNKLEAITIWVRQGKFAEELPLNELQKPSFTVNSLYDLKKILKLLIN